ncbi:nucleoporin NDC1 [Vigna unguiculata]|uniref:Nucleoporin NDC1 n=1 Tax=Vigna unguiculata TaxID=3917 RepID=A0A4D6KMX7_VIGUN|nr:nucleoporin NDC1 [Vigna unguiculata]
MMMMSGSRGRLEMLVKNRLMSFLIWQSISSSIVFLHFLCLPLSSPHYPFFSFIVFLSSHLLFFPTLSFLSSPHPRPRLPLSLLFATAAAFSAALSLPAAAHPSSPLPRLAFRGFLIGSLFASHYLFQRRWLLHFPIIQRPPFFSFKMGVPSAARQAFKLSVLAFFISGVLLELLPHPFKYAVATTRFFVEQITSFAATFAIFFSWELTHHLHWVLHTKRAIFAPPKGSAAAETNPSEHLLSALEETNPTSLPRYLAHLDLYMVCENNVDTWRRAGFFEETGETYKRVVAVCLKPLEHLATKLGEGSGSSVDKATQLSNQLLSPTDPRSDLKYVEELYNFQLYAWCSRSVASLTACSRKEDKFGVAQLSGSNAAVVSTLLSCLLAVENFMGKKTNLQPPNQLLGAAGIKWATVNSGRVDVAAGKRRSGPVNSKAYAIADVLKTSIYQIVSAFQDEMSAGAKANLLEKDWITTGKPVFGTREMLIQKLRIFLDFRAT